MKSVYGAVAISLLTGLVWTHPVQAQGQRIAQGTYLETCRNAGMKGNTLEADCRDRDGRYHHAVLPNAFACENRIANFDGRLVCQSQGGPGGSDRGYGDRGPGGPGYGAPGYGGPGYGDRGPGGPGYGDRGPGGPGYGDRGPGGSGYGDRGYGDRGAGGGVPAGSYQHSCERVVVRGEALAAFCRARDGRMRETVLDNVRRCRGDIGNNDGRLVCAQ